MIPLPHTPSGIRVSTKTVPIGDGGVVGRARYDPNLAEPHADNESKKIAESDIVPR